MAGFYVAEPPCIVILQNMPSNFAGMVIQVCIAYLLASRSVTTAEAQAVKKQPTSIIQIPVTGPLDLYLTNAADTLSGKSVFLIVTDKGTGTGFLHKSGRIITAQHVVNGAKTINVMVAGQSISVTNWIFNGALDVAALSPTVPISGVALKFSSQSSFDIGTQVTTWGFPGGYDGTAPLLCVGYLAGAQNVSGIPNFVVNAAFNSGNSGGPLLDPNGDVMGVVVSKLAPLPKKIEDNLRHLASPSVDLAEQIQKNRAD